MKLYYFLAILFCVLLFPSVLHAQVPDETLEGEIVSLENSEREDGLGDTYTVQRMEIFITKGSKKGATITVDNNTVSIVNKQLYESGDAVVIMKTIDYEGNELYVITDYVRRPALGYLFLLFCGLAILIGGMWGIFSLFGMGISFVVIFKVILPQILSGINPVLAAIEGAIIIIPLTFYMSHGFKRKTHVAVIATIITLVVTGILATIFVDAAQLTGFASEEAGFLNVANESLNMKGLLLAGIIIGTLGVLDDITISQASIVEELRLANKKMKKGDIFVSAMRVGRDHISSLINTLVLVYTGASLPLLLLFLGNDAPFAELINLELVADEVVRTLVGSIGLIIAVPIATVIAISLPKRKHV